VFGSGYRFRVLYGCAPFEVDFRMDVGLIMSDSQSILTFGEKRRRESRALAYVGILLVTGLPMLCVQPAMGEASAPAAGAELSQRGARLQAAITATYEELRQNRALRFAPQGGCTPRFSASPTFLTRSKGMRWLAH
jgi:hypothetical protein